MLCVVDECTRECLTIRVERRPDSHVVEEVLFELFLQHGLPDQIRSDNRPEFIATSLREWLRRIGAKTLYITPASPWENGCCRR